MAGSSWSEPLMSLSDGVYWLGMDGPGPSLAEFVLVGSVGWVVHLHCWKGRGVVEEAMLAISVLALVSPAIFASAVRAVSFLAHGPPPSSPLSGC